MKKILSILGTIYLSTIISTNIIACNPTNENKK
ncbi:MAG: lipoprotein, partial [Spiroplasma sp. hy2]